MWLACAWYRSNLHRWSVLPDLWKAWDLTSEKLSLRCSPAHRCLPTCLRWIFAVLPLMLDSQCPVDEKGFQLCSHSPLSASEWPLCPCLGLLQSRPHCSLLVDVAPSPERSHSQCPACDSPQSPRPPTWRPVDDKPHLVVNLQKNSVELHPWHIEVGYWTI